MRLITASWAIALVSLVLAGCGGEGLAVDSPATANDTASGGGASTTPPATTPPTSTPPSAPPAATTASATLYWIAPTANSDGSELTNLAGYNIYFGTTPTALTQTVQVANAAALNYVLNGLSTGSTWYFEVTSYTTSGQESAPSTVTSKKT